PVRHLPVKIVAYDARQARALIRATRPVPGYFPVIAILPGFRGRKIPGSTVPEVTVSLGYLVDLTTLIPQPPAGSGPGRGFFREISRFNREIGAQRGTSPQAT